MTDFEITTYMAAQNARDVDAAMACYAPDAVVTDDGHTYRGTDEIRGWLAGAAKEYTYTTEPVSTTRLDDEHYDVVQHLEGDFPGGVVDLHYRFTLRGSSIAELTIEP
ncbi:nuclear transport factor 2 family protein [Dactylosporangium sp. CA-092794]|uniref:nuclear transport factor 2 family protein n=1 Tax=Dactylosporangium sp. CA-092794 TaxID=3239929 RepID=UPI003D89C6F6